MPSRDERPVTLPESGSPANLADFGTSLAVIVTHPWGPLGGNMNNNVVLALVFWFQRIGVTTLRFNFCGSQIGRGHTQGSCSKCSFSVATLQFVLQFTAANQRSGAISY